MRKSNTAKNSTISSNFLLLVPIIMPILMVVASSTLMLASLSSAAFASHGDDYLGHLGIYDIAKGSNNNNQLGQENHGALIGNLISQQQSPQAYARNVNEDNKVIIVENCEDGEVIINDNDQIIQTNTQSFNQEANNKVDEEEEEEEEEEEDG
jgi:signal transduction histidine kinase